MAYYELISNNKLVSALVAAALLGIFGWIVKLCRDYRDRKKIYGYLQQSRLDTTFTFRSTEAISSETKIPETRVAELCSRHPNIKRNAKEKQSWQLTE
jgi:hypothetical protein